MKSVKKIIIATIILVVAVLPVSPFDPSVYSQEVEVISSDEKWITDKTIDKLLVIDEGVKVEINKGVTINFNGGRLIVLGDLIMKGTIKNPIKIRNISSDESYSIQAEDRGKIDMKNVDVSGGGEEYYPTTQMPFLKSVYAEAYKGAISILYASLKAENCNFHDNIAAVTAEVGSSNNISVNKSKFINNSKDVFVVGDFSEKANFRYNWWGNINGPEIIEEDPVAYSKITDNIDFYFWAEREDFHDPVIVIPGILGSQKKNGVWKMDLIFHTYDNLYQEFADNGYVPEKDLFEFPYEWRDSNIDNALLLKEKIEVIKQKSKWPSVDIVAHSMGGLLAREYVESSDYENDVDQLITLGTPHNGSPEAYLKWDGDGWFWSLRDLYAKSILKQEAEELGYADLFDYIHQRPISSLKELLPVYNYLQEVENNYEYKIYPDGYPRNEFLENINNETNKSKLKDIEFDKIIGDVESNSSTIAGFKVVETDMGKYWQHGYPLGFEIIIGDRGLVKNKGDRTVSLESALSPNIPSDEEITINAVHGDLPTKAQKDVLELLTGTRPESENNDSLVEDIFIASVYSPIDIQIIAPDGKKVGKNFETGGEYNQIPGAYYSGSDTDNEFLTIPNPLDGEYKILTQGTGEGEYRVEAKKIVEKDNSGQAIESSAEITGTASVGSQEELKIELANNEVIADQDKIAPIVKTVSPKSGSYKNSIILSVAYDVSDDVSALEKIKKEVFFDGAAMASDRIDLSLEHLGAHNVSVKATDEAGNVGEDKVEFSNITDINSIISNVNHYYDLHLITKSETKNYLQAKLRIIKGELQLIGILEKMNLPKKTKDRLLNPFKKIVNLEIGMLVKQIEIERNLNKTINPKIKKLLVESLEAIKV